VVKSRKIIVTCAVTGSIHTPSMSPHLPITPTEIANQSIAAAAAGASILHLHARDPITGEPTPSPEVFMQFLPEINSETDAIINITTGGSHLMTLDERIAAARHVQPELASLNMGAMIFDFSAAANRITHWHHSWEKPYVEGSRNRVMYNTNHFIERICREIGQEYGTRFEFECYDVGHLYTLAHAIDRKLVEPPFFVQCILGILGGVGPELSNLTHMAGIAERLFGDDLVLSVFAAGRHQMPFCTLSMLLGGNVRVGLEDNLYIGPGKLAENNADQVTKIVRILNELSFGVASPDETRSLLKLKGRNHIRL
jgi:uncharacterized protein (DUF849 family)